MLRLTPRLALAAPLLLAAAPSAAGDVTTSASQDWISVHVALEGPCVVESLDFQEPLGSPTNVARSQRQLENLRLQQEIVGSQVEALGGEITANLMRLTNALQVRIPKNRADRLADLPGVIRVEPVPVHQRSLTSAVPFVNAPQAWEALPGTGDGIKIGIIDTGIDYLHADFGGSGNPADYKANNRTLIEPGTFPTPKVAGGWDFVGDAYDGYNTPQPDPDPLDCFEEESLGIAGGHGTHVAGIAAGLGVNLDGSTFTDSYLASLDPKTFKVFPGVAPEATLFALKIFGCDGGTNMVARAIEWAVDPDGDGDLSDRLDVLNLSLGGSYGLHSTTEAELVKNASLAGILLVVAAGNDGDVFFVTGEPATYTETLSVAATVDEISYLAMKIVSPASVAGDVPCAEGSFSEPLATTGPITGKLAATIPERACADLQNPEALAGNIAFIQRGDCYFVDKVQRAVDAGALAVVMVNNVDGEPFRMGGDGSQKPIPSVMIRREDGANLTPHLTQNVVVTLDADNVLASETASDQMASFSSRGPRTLDARLKPDISAPGFSILSAGVGSGTSPRETSGTSMACPMAAGAAAVLRQVHPSLSAFDIKAMLMNTTAPLANGTGVPVPVSLGGAGRIRVLDSASQSVTAAAANPPGAVSLSFGTVFAAEPRSESLEVIVTNHGDKDQTFTTSTVPTFALEGATIEVSPSTLSIPAQGSATLAVTLTIDPDQLPLEQPDPHTPAEITIREETFKRHYLTEFGGHVVLSGTDQHHLRVPFHAVVRAVDRRRASNAAMCIDGNDSPVTIPIDGLSTHKAPVVSVFQHVVSHPTLPLGTVADSSLDIVEVGIASNLATAASFAEASLYFAVTVAGDWTTPAKGPLSTLAVAIDTTGDMIEDYVVYAEPSSAMRYRDILRATTYRLATGRSAGRALLNVVAPDVLSTRPFLNNVVILPVPLEALEGLTEDAASFSFYVYTQQMTFPQKRDKTTWVQHDPTRAPVDTARAGHDGTPLFGPQDPIRLFLRHEFFGQEPPSVLLMHHTNEPGMRAEVLSLADVGAVYPSDLSVTQQQPDAIKAGGSGSWTVQVTNVSGGEARDVTLTLSVTDGAKVTNMQADDATCSPTGCLLRSLSPGEEATVSVTVEAGDLPFEATARVSNAADCELDTSNNKAVVDVDVDASGSGGSGGAGGSGGSGGSAGSGATPGVPADVTEFEPGGGCSCRTASPAIPAGAWVLGLAALALVRRRRDPMS
jgi:MYXO-CTERM domain-containing protein